MYCNSFTTDNIFALKLPFLHNTKIGVKFEGNCLKQNKVSLSHGNVETYFIVYELVARSRDLKIYFALKDCLFGAAKSTKIDKFFCS